MLGKKCDADIQYHPYMAGFANQALLLDTERHHIVKNGDPPVHIHRQQLDSAYKGQHNKPSSISDRSPWTLARAEAEEWRRPTILLYVVIQRVVACRPPGIARHQIATSF